MMIKKVISTALTVVICGILLGGMVGCEDENRTCDRIQGDLVAQGPSMGALGLVQEFASAGCFNDVLGGF